MEKRLVLFLLLLLLILPQKALAQTKSAGASLTLVVTQDTIETDKRVKILKGFLESYNSPLATHAAVFVKNADTYELDYRLVAAISGVESTFGHQIPTNSYNAWGWGIYGNNTLAFESYDQAIETISKGLRSDYINKWKAKDVYDIGHFYAASPTWAQRVEYFMNKMHQYELNNPQLALSLSL